MPDMLVYTTPSICRCGYPTLNETVSLGKVYEVDLSSVRGGFRFVCGGRGVEQRNVTVILCRESTGRFAPLPLAIFGAATAASLTSASLPPDNRA